MDKEDLKKIREELASVIEDNINPQFEELGEKIEGLEGKTEGLEKRMGGLEEDVRGIKNQMVTKAYLDEKLADLSGETIIRLKKEDAKVNRLIEIMGGKKILDEKEIKELEEIKVFPRPAS